MIFFSSNFHYKAPLLMLLHSWKYGGSHPVFVCLTKWLIKFLHFHNDDDHYAKLRSRNQKTGLKLKPLNWVSNMSNAPALRANLVCTSFNQINSKGLFVGDDPLDYSVPALLLQLSLISVFTRIIQSLLKPLGQPLIVSQILVSIYISLSFFISLFYLMVLL